MLVDKIVDNFNIDGFWWAVNFAILLSLVEGFINIGLAGRKKNREV